MGRLLVHHLEISRVLDPDARLRETTIPPESVSNSDVFSSQDVESGLTTTDKSLSSETPPRDGGDPHDADSNDELDREENKNKHERGGESRWCDHFFQKTALAATRMKSRLSTVLYKVSSLVMDLAELPMNTNSKTFMFFPFMMVALSVLINLFPYFFFEPSPVTAGLSQNRDFLYCLQTYYEFLALLPLIHTCFYAVPDGTYPFWSRAVTLVVVLAVQKVVDALIAERPFSSEHRNVFPIPFSLVVLQVVAFLLVPPVILIFSPSRRRGEAGKKSHFRSLYACLTCYWVTLIVGMLWSVWFQKVRDSPFWRVIAGLSFAPIRFACKILMTANYAMRLKPLKWMAIVSVVDIILMQVQICTVAFIDNLLMLLQLIVQDLVVDIAWRGHGGVDRLSLLWQVIGIWMKGENDDNEKRGSVMAQVMSVVEEKEGGSSFVDTVRACFVATNAQTVFQLNLGFEKAKVDAAEAADHEHDKASCRSDSSVATSCTASVDECGDAASKDDPTATEFEMTSAQHCFFCSWILLGWTPNNDNVQDQSAMESSDEHDTDQLVEKDWKQRPLFHCLDAVSAQFIQIFISGTYHVTLIIVRNHPTMSKNLNDSFMIDQDRWQSSMLYGWILVFVLTLFLACLRPLVFARLGLNGDDKLTLRSAMSYLFRDNFWHYAFWFWGIGAFSTASMFVQFGFDVACFV